MADYILNIIIQGDGSGLDPAAASLEHLTTATQATGAAAAGATGQSQGFFSGIFSNLANIGAGIGMLQGFASGVAGVGQSLIAGSAEFEGYEARFPSHDMQVVFNMGSFHWWCNTHEMRAWTDHSCYEGERQRAEAAEARADELTAQLATVTAERNRDRKSVV